MTTNKNPNNFDWARLKDKQKEVQKAENFPQDLGLKIHRALSWLQRAEVAEDDDTSFISLWIAFNAAYAQQIRPEDFEKREIYF